MMDAPLTLTVVLGVVGFINSIVVGFNFVQRNDECTPQAQDEFLADDQQSATNGGQRDQEPGDLA